VYKFKFYVISNELICIWFLFERAIISIINYVYLYSKLSF